LITDNDIHDWFWVNLKADACEREIDIENWSSLGVEIYTNLQRIFRKIPSPFSVASPHSISLTLCIRQLLIE
jgi:hypothetical protein